MVQQGGLSIDGGKVTDPKATVSKEILSKDEFADGIFHGKYKRYHSNNNLEEEGSYVDGKKDGLWKKYSFQGELQIENQYKDGELI